MKKVIMFVLTAMVLSSCSDFIDLKPIDFPTEETFYKDVKGLEGAVIGIYDELQSSDQYGAKFMTLMEVRGDNVKNDNSGASGGITYQIEVFTETPANSNLSGAWLSLYKTIYRCNWCCRMWKKCRCPTNSALALPDKLRLYVLFVTLTWFACGARCPSLQNADRGRSA